MKQTTQEYYLEVLEGLGSKRAQFEAERLESVKLSLCGQIKDIILECTVEIDLKPLETLSEGQLRHVLEKALDTQEALYKLQEEL